MIQRKYGNIHNNMNLTFDSLTVYKGFSQNPNFMEQLKIKIYLTHLPFSIFISCTFYSSLSFDMVHFGHANAIRQVR